MSNRTQYVWYASYGSNINEDRFLCYIKGGSPAGSLRMETGSKDSSLPVDESTYIIHHPLYFAKEAEGWHSQGVAFIALKQNAESVTYSKMYLITMEQFLDVVKQENSGIEVNIDLSEVKEKGALIYRRNSWYGNILYLGEQQGFPIFTFTAPWDIDEVDWKKPSHQYLGTIIKGLKKDYSTEKVYDYFKNKPGIKGNYSDEELAKLVESDLLLL